jgi:hypothetical protein
LCLAGLSSDGLNPTPSSSAGGMVCAVVAVLQLGFLVRAGACYRFDDPRALRRQNLFALPDSVH